ncbi:MAG: OsmC family protein, partial [Hyphomicrobiales bacterium]|nr:OsmC family protein [Hyphomicrobiales bacterium]
WRFDGGVEVPASSSPLSVKLPLSRADAVDPEEALVAALSSCHMLFFLDFAKRKGFIVDSYVDEAIGTMSANAEGRVAMTDVVLHPRIIFSGDKRPTKADCAELHHEAHEDCYIANSVRSAVRVESSEHGLAAV